MFRSVTAQHHGKRRHITRRADLAYSGGHDQGKQGFRASRLFRHYSSGVIHRLGYQGADYFENRNSLVLI